jgi:uncharacterized protein YggT (Ycf19 family)
MGHFMINLGWLLDVFSLIWICLILLDLICIWIFGPSQSGFYHEWVHGIAQLPVNFLRATLPTVYRNTDFAPYLALLLLVLMKTFVFRAIVYWGMLHHLPQGLG